MTDTDKTIIWTTGKKTALAVILTIWFAAAAYIGREHLLQNTAASMFAPIALSAVVPVLAFLALYRLSGGFRRFVLAQDIETLTMLQHWRVLGFAFLPLYFYGVLPGVFAFPAGLGDLALGLTAPLIILRLRRDPEYATSTGLVRYQYLGLLDFAVAVITAGVTAGAFPELISNGVTSGAMDVWPLNLFPSFGVPIFIILHLTVLLKVRDLRRRSATPVVNALQTA
ncbi:MAG: hypothetical protein ACE5EU_08110 [Paracoccaceae bacterium]